MASRFVWQKYSIDVEYNEETVYDTRFSIVSSSHSVIACSAIDKNESNGTVSPSGDTVTLHGSGGGNSAGTIDYPFVVPNQGSTTYYCDSGIGSRRTWRVSYRNDGVTLTVRNDSGSDVGCDRITIVPTQTKGASQGYASSATDGQYPADGVSGNVYVSAHSLHLSRTIPRRKIHQYQPIQGIVLAVSYGEGLGHFDETAA